LKRRASRPKTKRCGQCGRGFASCGEPFCSIECSDKFALDRLATILESAGPQMDDNRRWFIAGSRGVIYPAGTGYLLIGGDKNVLSKFCIRGGNGPFRLVDLPTREQARLIRIALGIPTPLPPRVGMAATRGEMSQLILLEGIDRERYAELIARREKRRCVCIQCRTRYDSYRVADDLFCSTVCALGYREERKKTCSSCGGEFTAKRSDARYCSRKCRNAARRG
jgi:hypothetical protein